MILIFLAIWLHFIGDFLLQNDKMALNKSHSFKWLTIHALTYGLPFALVFSLVYGLLFGLGYAIINAGLHWLVDAVTSRITKRLWEANERHWFFVVIGLDQAIHFTCLVYTPVLFFYLFGKNL